MCTPQCHLESSHHIFLLLSCPSEALFSVPVVSITAAERPCSLPSSCKLDLICKQAEKSLIGKGNKEYLPIQGLASFNKATAELLLGPDSPAIKEVGPPLSYVPLMSNLGLSNPVPCNDHLSTL